MCPTIVSSVARDHGWYLHPHGDVHDRDPECHAQIVTGPSWIQVQVCRRARVLMTWCPSLLQLSTSSSVLFALGAVTKSFAKTRSLHTWETIPTAWISLATFSGRYCDEGHWHCVLFMFFSFFSRGDNCNFVATRLCWVGLVFSAEWGVII